MMRLLKLAVLTIVMLLYGSYGLRLFGAITMGFAQVQVVSETGAATLTR